MKVYISYFYQLRFFPADMLPLSTAVWDPKWYSQNGAQFVDKRGVLNGCKFGYFMPNSTCNGLCRGPKECRALPNSCEFLKKYRAQLDALDFDKALEDLEDRANRYGKKDVCLMVYEVPDNPCSERVVLKQWFADHGYELEEWRKG